ncbi:MAG: hypothetical protein KAT61_01025 [Gammaproteobacteria bacterium]|nr:hypothetical protein [Gammaproteobacteria bacterium]
MVVHLRSLYYPGNPLEIFPLNLLTHRDFAIELARELATVVMILSVALLAARGFTFETGAHLRNLKRANW